MDGPSLRRVEPRSEGWVEPQLTDLGGLTELTESIDLFFGPAQGGAHDLSFSGLIPGGGDIGGSTTPVNTQGTTSPGPGAGSPGGGAGGGATGSVGHGELPFTGYSLPVVAAVGSMLSAAGLAIRRALGRADRPRQG
jgi:hypothetical protein